MRNLLLRRLLQLPVVIVGVLTLVFLIQVLTPGDVAAVIAGDYATPETVEEIRESLGLNKPLYMQYFTYLGNFFVGDLGNSVFTGRPVLDEILRTLPNTVELMLVALVISTTVGVSSGIIAALRPGSLFDKTAMFGALAGLSIPNFVFGLLLILLFSVTLGVLPTSGRGGSLLDISNWPYVIMPAVALSLSSIGSLARVSRSSVLEVMPEDYMRTARSKGLSSRTLIGKHALKNASLPIITLLGLQLGFFLGGSVVIETVFGWPGMGRLSVQAIFNRDFPLVQGCIAIFAIFYVLANLIVDLFYGVIDPRTRVRQ